jgi:hypothetical protein
MSGIIRQLDLVAVRKDGCLQGRVGCTGSAPAPGEGTRQTELRQALAFPPTQVLLNSRSESNPQRRPDRVRLYYHRLTIALSTQTHNVHVQALDRSSPPSSGYRSRCSHRRYRPKRYSQPTVCVRSLPNQCARVSVSPQYRLWRCDLHRQSLHGLWYRHLHVSWQWHSDDLCQPLLLLSLEVTSLIT